LHSTEPHINAHSSPHHTTNNKTEEYSHRGGELTMEQDNTFTRYVYLLTMNPGKQLDEQIIRAHVRYLKDLEEIGKLVLCGPFSDYNGGMVIFRANSYDDALEVVRSDPFVKENYESFELRTLELSCKENNHMGMG